MGAGRVLVGCTWVLVGCTGVLVWHPGGSIGHPWVLVGLPGGSIGHPGVLIRCPGPTDGLYLGYCYAIRRNTDRAHRNTGRARRNTDRAPRCVDRAPRSTGICSAVHWYMLRNSDIGSETVIYEPQRAKMHSKMKNCRAWMCKNEKLGA